MAMQGVFGGGEFVLDEGCPMLFIRHRAVAFKQTPHTDAGSDFSIATVADSASFPCVCHSPCYHILQHDHNFIHNSGDPQPSGPD